MLRQTAALLLSAAAWLVPNLARAAEARVFLSVQRRAGSEMCPDPERIRKAAESLFPETPLVLVERAPEAVLAVRVVVEKTPRGHEATLSIAGEHPRERQIVDADPACTGLPEALAVAVVLLLPEKKPRHAEASTALTSTHPKAAWGFETGALGAVGWLGSPAAGAFAGVFGTWRSPILLRARALRLLATSTEVDPGPGRVDVSLWALLGGPCLRFAAARDWTLTPCLEIGWGRQQGAASGLLGENHVQSRPWVVAGPTLGLDWHLARPLALGADAGGTLRLHEQAFLVDGNTVQAQEPLGFFLALRLSGTFFGGR
jgi:hypothetical protein